MTGKPTYEKLEQMIDHLGYKTVTKASGIEALESFRAFVMKPIMMRDLAETIRKALDNKKGRDTNILPF
jgi:hypothetical protein